MIDITEDSRKLLSCVYRVGQRFGAGHVIDVLRGSKKDRIVQLGHHELSTYGIGAGENQHYWGCVVRHLVHQGYLDQDVAAYSILKLTERSRPLLRGEVSLQMARPRIRDSVREKRGGPAASLLPDYDEQLFERLRAVRMELARQANVPPFVIFHDRTLAEMALHKPRSLEDLGKIHGVGAGKCERYGALFIDEIAAFSDNQ